MGELNTSKPFQVIIVGAGIGGLVCAISSAREGLAVKVLERAPEILPIGAGIQIPPNAARILASLDLLPKIRETAIEVQKLNFRRYEDGRLLASRKSRSHAQWFVIHRADYHQVLLDEAKRLGVEIQLNASVKDISFEDGVVYLEDDTTLKGDVVIGGDGSLWSTTREKLLGKDSQPFQTGDLAYRGTFTLEQLEALNDPRVEELCKEPAVTVWFGPEKHCVFYPVRGGTQFNLVLLRPDNLPQGTRTVKGDIEEMRYTFHGWDSVLTKIISCIPSVLRWKLCHHDELDTWTKGRVALLGDACHPTLPYQAQGAAMAVEDGAILGRFLGKLFLLLQNGSISPASEAESISRVLKLYETIRKHRTTQNVQGAISNRHFYHLPDGPEQQKRDEEMAKHSFTTETSEYKFLDMKYNADLLEVPVLREAGKAFDSWWSSHTEDKGEGNRSLM
ncbi:FAD/NAD(P)-binding domain-containing protein [Eremomyces bilateralis CBS 781.70]|uniref:FAD/NAD(P)-binding domain-containing protein n=1 Tax=Eremomyces bilateralis CBS 781.70 TaxID=1392243 RepID=A0A6G1G602_9PEZI|nr:FAD/NAD(P)-binding domain-containing protein [Eremomyces bilateralis CBS 781.70]KAF1813356.1 FAD/NAD(P)-binding domain-containing protein [Eremomyces bilateralis CBS 781.70]